MKRYLLIVIIPFLLSGCGEGTSIPPWFEHVANQDAYHFVYIDPDKVNFKDKVALRRGGKAVCAKFKHNDYCEIYIWNKRELVSKALPVENREHVVAIYKLKDGKIKISIKK